MTSEPTTSGLKKTLFLHIQKTGGTSVVNMVRKHYRSLCSHGDCLGHPPSEFRDVEFVSGHFGYSYFEELMKDRYLFTFLRDPIDRIISFYYFCKTRDPKEYEVYQRAHNLVLEDFLYAGLKEKLVKFYIWNNQTWQLACGFCNPKGLWHDDFFSDELLRLAIDHVMTFSRIGITETLEADKKLIAGDLGFDYVASEPYNVNPDRPRKEDISPLALEILHDLTRLDRELYDRIIQARSARISKRMP